MSAKIPTVNEVWKDYRTNCIPPQASDLQVKESKRVFFSAFHACLLILRDEVAAIPSDEGAQRALESLHNQCRGFQEAMKLGEA